jgi:hypothetical protein
VSVQFSDSLGFSVTEPAIRVTSTGTVVVAAPFYVSPSSNQITQGTVSVVLTQGTSVSPAVSITIQNLPTVSSYGAQPGQITHAFLVFEATLHARRINEFQAAQPFLNFDTTAAQSTLQSLQKAAYLTREDVDNVTLNSASLSWGSLPDGTVLQFDSTALDMMDRIIALYITQQFAPVTDVVAMRQSRREKREAEQPHPAASGGSTLLQLFSTQQGTSTLIDQGASAPNASDSGFSFLEGIKTLLENSGFEKLAGGVGILSGFHHISAALDSYFADLGEAFNCAGSPTCTAAEGQTIANNVQNDALNFAAAEVDTLTNVPVIAGAEAESQIASTLSQGFQGFVNWVQAENSGSVQAADNADVQLASPSTLGSIGAQIADVIGNVMISSNLGIQAPQTSVELCCIGSTQEPITAVADPSGNYDLYVPVGVAGTLYNSLTLSGFDLFSTTTLSSEVVDLSTLGGTAVFSPPQMFGTCNDDDAGNPDSDDPDCD